MAGDFIDYADCDEAFQRALRDALCVYGKLPVDKTAELYIYYVAAKYAEYKKEGEGELWVRELDVTPIDESEKE